MRSSKDGFFVVKVSMTSQYLLNAESIACSSWLSYEYKRSASERVARSHSHSSSTHYFTPIIMACGLGALDSSALGSCVISCGHTHHSNTEMLQNSSSCSKIYQRVRSQKRDIYACLLQYSVQQIECHASGYNLYIKYPLSYLYPRVVVRHGKGPCCIVRTARDPASLGPLLCLPEVSSNLRRDLTSPTRD